MTLASQFTDNEATLPTEAHDSAIWKFNDGGRAKAGFKGQASDCVVRAISIATDKPYRDVYEELYSRSKHYAQNKRDKVARALSRKGKTSPRLGCHKKVYHPWLLELGWVWTPTMAIGSGCTTHLRPDELPSGVLIVSLSKHISVVIDGVIHDTYDCSRSGSRCVYGYYSRSGVTSAEESIR